MKTYNVKFEIDEELPYEAENADEAIANAKDWLLQNIDRVEFTAEEVDINA